MPDNYPVPPQNQDDPYSLARHIFSVSFFKDQFAFEIRRETMTLLQLANIIEHERGPKRSELPWLKLSVFGDKLSKRKSYRHDANVVEVNGVEIDHDAGTKTFMATVKAMQTANIRCIAYTSPSFIPGTKERWRVLAPCSEPVPPSTRVKLTERLNGVLEGAAARESFVLSQAFYYGAIEGNAHHQVVVIDGDFIDLADDLDAGAIGKPPPLPPSRVKRAMEPTEAGHAISRSEEEIIALLKAACQIGPGGEKQWHNSMLMATASMIGKGWSDERIFEVCKPYCPLGLNEDDFKKIIRGGREKYRPVDPGVDWSTKLAMPLKAIAAASGAQLPIAAPQWRERYASNLPRASFYNARLAIISLGMQCSHDTFHNQLWIGRNANCAPSEPLPAFLGQITDDGIGGLRQHLSEVFGLDFTEKHVRDAVSVLAYENAFDPVIDMLTEAERNWDGIARLDRMAVDYLNCEDSELNRRCVRKTMLGAVARARIPGIKFDTILVMESPQGWNKSSAWRVLAGEDNFSDEAIMGKSSREVMEALSRVWIHENAELAGMRKADIDTVTAFASRQVDRARPAYGHYVMEQPRHSIEVGTINAERYLQSQFGNRRFWPMKVMAPIDLGKLRTARLQLWGEAAHYQSQGESLVLDPALWGAAGAAQEARRVKDPWETILAGLTSVAHAGPLAGIGPIGNGVVHTVPGELRVGTAVIFEHVLRLQAGQLNINHSRRLADSMRHLGWKKGVFVFEGKTTRGYVRNA